MPKNVVEKILLPHIISGEPKVGNEVAIKIDQTLTQDATGTTAYLAFETLGLNKLKFLLVMWIIILYRKVLKMLMITSICKLLPRNMV